MCLHLNKYYLTLCFVIFNIFYSCFNQVGNAKSNSTQKCPFARGIEPEPSCLRWNIVDRQLQHVTELKPEQRREKRVRM